jgi:hypothetical protein
MSFALLGLLVLAQTSTTTTSTLTESPDSREDSIFGDDEEPAKKEHERSPGWGECGGRTGCPEPPGEPPPDERGSILPDEGEETKEGVIDELEETLGTTNDYLDIGGALWLWLQYEAKEEGDAGAFRLRSPSFLDLYADARPLDRLRAFVQGRLLFDFTVNDETVNAFTGVPEEMIQVLLDQFWLKFDILQTVYLTAGKQRIRWGVGQIWQPTDFINQQRRDPISLFDRRLGVSLLKLHLPIESLGWNFYAIANFEGVDQIQKIGGAFRAELVFGPAEIGLTGAFQKDEPQRIGADISIGLWLFDVRLEAALSHRVTTPFFRGDPDFSDGVQLEDLQAIERVDRRGDWIPQIVAGADITIAYSDQDTITIGGEYFFNDAGVSNPELYPFMFIEGTFMPFYVGRHYAALFVLLNGPGTWDDTNFFLSGIGNLSDRSFVTRLQYQVRFFNYLSVQAFINYYFGREGELHLGIDVPPGGTVPGFENGFEIIAPLLDVGVALTVEL